MSESHELSRSHKLSRRDFIKVTTGIAGSLVGAVIGVPALASNPKPEDLRDGETFSGKTDGADFNYYTDPIAGIFRLRTNIDFIAPDTSKKYFISAMGIFVDRTGFQGPVTILPKKGMFSSDLNPPKDFDVVQFSLSEGGGKPSIQTFQVKPRQSLILRTK